MTIRITTPQNVAKPFCAGVCLSGGHVARAAPILRYMLGWTEQRIRQYAAGKRWAVEVVE